MKQMPCEEVTRSFPWFKLGAGVCVVAGWLALSQFLPVHAALTSALRGVALLGPWGPFAFILLYLPVCIIVFPDLIPNLAAGVLWGPVWGTLFVSVGRGLGSAVAFLLSRWGCSAWVAERAATHPRFAAVSQVVGEEGFKTALLLRLCPIVPANLLHYALGLTSISFRSYVAATFLGMLPRTFVIAYLGAGAGSLAELTRAGGMGHPLPQPFYWAGLALTVLVTVYVSRLARRALREATAAVG